MIANHKQTILDAMEDGGTREVDLIIREAISDAMAQCQNAKAHPDHEDPDFWVKCLESSIQSGEYALDEINSAAFNRLEEVQRLVNDAAKEEAKLGDDYSWFDAKELIRYALEIIHNHHEVA